MFPLSLCTTQIVVILVTSGDLIEMERSNILICCREEELSPGAAAAGAAKSNTANLPTPDSYV